VKRIWHSEAARLSSGELAATSAHEVKSKRISPVFQLAGREQAVEAPGEYILLGLDGGIPAAKGSADLLAPHDQGPSRATGLITK
jgi:hypothetical protein